MRAHTPTHRDCKHAHVHTHGGSVLVWAHAPPQAQPARMPLCGAPVRVLGRCAQVGTGGCARAPWLRLHTGVGTQGVHDREQWVCVRSSACLHIGSRGCLVMKSLFILPHLSPSES